MTNLNNLRYRQTNMVKQLLPQFDPDNEPAYRQWRKQKLLDYPNGIEQLVVEFRNPARFIEVEREAMLQRIRKSNRVIFAGPTGDEPDKPIPRQLGAQFGWRSLDNNIGADDAILNGWQLSETPMKSSIDQGQGLWPQPGR